MPLCSLNQVDLQLSGTTDQLMARRPLSVCWKGLYIRGDFIKLNINLTFDLYIKTRNEQIVVKKATFFFYYFVKF